jgi:hypothetical protein
VFVVGALDAKWCTLIVLALIGCHFALKHYGREGLFGGKYRGRSEGRSKLMSVHFAV